jgi:hypothetical protein
MPADPRAHNEQYDFHAMMKIVFCTKQCHAYICACHHRHACCTHQTWPVHASQVGAQPLAEEVFTDMLFANIQGKIKAMSASKFDR